MRVMNSIVLLVVVVGVSVVVTLNGVRARDQGPPSEEHLHIQWEEWRDRLGHLTPRQVLSPDDIEFALLPRTPYGLPSKVLMRFTATLAATFFTFRPQSAEHVHSDDNQDNDVDGETAHLGEIIAVELSELLDLRERIPPATLVRVHVSQYLDTFSKFPQAQARLRGLLEPFAKDGIIEGVLQGYYLFDLVDVEAPEGCHPESGLDVRTCPAPERDEWVSLALFDFLLGNTDRHTGGNALAYHVDMPRLLWIDHDAVGLAKRYDALDMYVIDQSMFWRVQDAIHRYHFGRAFGGFCEFPEALLERLRELNATEPVEEWSIGEAARALLPSGDISATVQHALEQSWSGLAGLGGALRDKLLAREVDLPMEAFLRLNYKLRLLFEHLEAKCAEKPNVKDEL